MKLITVLAAFLCLALVTYAGAMAPRADLLTDVCPGLGDGFESPETGITCPQQHCDWECTRTTIETALGDGYTCLCGLMGPHPDCCRLVSIPYEVIEGPDLYPFIWTNFKYTTSGNCGSAGCGQPAGTCKVKGIAPRAVCE